MANSKIGPPAPGVCGPDITNQLISAWKRIQDDFRKWTPLQKELACIRILIPLNVPAWLPGANLVDVLKNIKPDIDGWDLLPLYQGAAQWLHSSPVFDGEQISPYNPLGGPCATPSSVIPLDLSNPFQDAYEDEMTCSNTVAVHGQCWLNGTVNYGTYGIMTRLCADEFPLQFGKALSIAQILITTYKRFGPHPEDPTLPLAWVAATFKGGPSGFPPNGGNRPQCKCSCPCKDSDITIPWDYVWEPIKRRDMATFPTIFGRPIPFPIIPKP